ncbi:hypothetical protein [Psychroserpens mesophilus]|uniref:hypothetical protein n=1 Tax=Psychroserpens mesophilus TaxID=325473 RepID=UPI003D656D8D
MRKFLYVLCFGLLFTTCDDGDVFEITLDFDDTFSQCGSLVFYKINTSTSESLSIQFQDLTIEELLEVDENFVYENTILLGSSNVFNYRSYANLPANADDVLFCNDIPPSNLGIERDEVSTGGEVYIRTVLAEDDNDGILSEFEDENLDGDNDPDTNPTDTDGDGIPNYLDADDDGDNVLTIDELDTENLDGDDNPLTNPKNTDANSLINPDTIPDYLDSDDDGDGVDTIDEEGVNTPDNDPTNDITIDDTLNPEGIADYLNDQITTLVPATGYRTHLIRMTYTVTVTVYNISLPSITQQTLEFGTLDDSDTTVITREGSPVFD